MPIPHTLHFDNAFVRDLPADPETTNRCRQVESAAYSLVTPEATSAPQLLAYSTEVAELLGISSADMQNPEWAAVLTGNALLEGMQPYAMCYGGHQFGGWAGQLGDGRAINLGEVIPADGSRWALQLKGAGMTPYSRNGDGRAVLRSSIREFLCSEAMFHLGVPTTRALSLSLTGDSVMRDMFYSGNPQDEAGAVVCRVAPSFIRFGSFQIFAKRGDLYNLRVFTDFCIRTDFPHLVTDTTVINEDTYLQWLTDVAERTADMIIHWMRVGFVHGVMNTDNMSILGLTIDYGPYGWLEPYDPTWTPNTTDAQHGRYSFGQQMHIASWNMMQLINAIHPLTNNATRSQEILDTFGARLGARWQQMMMSKLGLTSADAADTADTAIDKKADTALAIDLLDVLELQECDYCIFFRLLATLPSNEAAADEQLFIAHIMPAYYDTPTADVATAMRTWLNRYVQRLSTETVSAEQRRTAMHAVNPKYVLRNYLAQQAIEKSEAGDHSMIHDLLDVLRHPYDEQADKEIFAAKRPEWARAKAGCSTLSCSS